MRKNYFPVSVLLLAAVGFAIFYLASGTGSSSLAQAPSAAVASEVAAPEPAPAPVELAQGLGLLPYLTQARSRSICAENPTGGKGQGGRAIPNPSEPAPAASARRNRSCRSGRLCFACSCSR